MRLKVIDMSFSAGGPFVAILNRSDALKIDVHAMDRISITHGGHEIAAVTDICENDKIIPPGSIGLFDEILHNIKLKKGNYVDISIAKKLVSLADIKKKMQGKKLSPKELDEIVKDIVSNNLSEVELAYFVAACYSHKLTMDEIVSLTKAIIRNSDRLNLNRKIVLDKHSIGGIPGNRTTMIVVPIIAATGFYIPKTSSRSITSPAGTSDTVETLCNVSFSVNEIKKIVEKTNGCLVWGGAVNLAAADDKMIKVRHPLSLDPEGMLLASILAKKAVVNSSHVLIDIPVGKTAKIASAKEAEHLKKEFQYISKKLGLKVKVIITDGSQPIGNGIGPNLEARDVLMVLRGTGPKDLKEKSIHLAAELLSMVKVPEPEKLARFTLESGLAYKKFKEILEAQGGNPDILPDQLKVGPHYFDFKARRTGIIHSIDNKIISKAARMAGAPKDKAAGIYLGVHNHYLVKKRSVLFRVYAESRVRLKYVKQFLDSAEPITIK